MPKYISNTSCTSVYTVGFLNMLADSIFYYMSIAFSKLDYRCLDPMSNFTLHFSFLALVTSPNLFNHFHIFEPNEDYIYAIKQRAFKSFAWIQVKEQQLPFAFYQVSS